jgi:uncharacterized protein YceK
MIREAANHVCECVTVGVAVGVTRNKGLGTFDNCYAPGARGEGATASSGKGRPCRPIVHRGVSHTSRDDTAAASSITAIDLEGSAFVDKANLPYSIITPYLIPSIAEDTGLLIFLAP